MGWDKYVRAVFFLPIGATQAAADAASAAVRYLGPKPPDYGATAGAAARSDSPNNRLTAQSNQARAYQAIPDVYGLRRVWPDLIQPSTIEYVDHVKFVTEWLCVSRGKGTLTAVQFADTPLDNVAGASYAVFEPVAPVGDLPENGTTTLTDVYETFASEEVNGQEITPKPAYSTVTKAGTLDRVAGTGIATYSVPDGADLDDIKAEGVGAFLRITSTSPASFLEGQIVSIATATGTTTIELAVPDGPTITALSATFSILNYGQPTGPFTLPIEADRCWVNVVYLNGLQGTVDYMLQAYRVDEAGDEIAGTRTTTSFVDPGTTLDQRFYTHKVTFPASGLWRMVFVRTTADLGNSSGTGKLESVSAVRYFATKTLPGVTVLRVTTQATESATGFRDRKFNARWARHVVGLTSSTAVSHSRNFGRALAHMWRLVGRPLAELDTDAIAAINAEHGEDSPLLRFDGSLDDADASLGERMAFAADTARCQVWRDGTRWTVTRDQFRSGFDLQLDYRNLARRGDSVLSYSGHIPDTFDGVEVEFVHEATQARKAYVRLDNRSGTPVAGTSPNPKRIAMLGCTTTAQAENRAHLEARRLLYQREFVADTALQDAAGVGLGAVVRWVDPDDFGGDGLQGGEVLTISGSTITTSERIDFKGLGSGRIQFTAANGARLGSPVVCTPGTGGAVVLDSVPAGLLMPDGELVQAGSRYAFAVGLTADEVDSAGLYTLVDAQPGPDGTVQVSLASYSARLYEADA